MLVIKATVIAGQEVVLDKQTFDKLVDRASKIEAVKVQEEQMPRRDITKSVDNERLTLLHAANYLMPIQQEARMRELLEKNSEGQLNAGENAELDNLMDEYEQRTMEKAEALVKLKLK